GRLCRLRRGRAAADDVADERGRLCRLAGGTAARHIGDEWCLRRRLRRSRAAAHDVTHGSNRRCDGASLDIRPHPLRLAGDAGGGGCCNGEDDGLLTQPVTFDVSLFERLLQLRGVEAKCDLVAVRGTKKLLE